MIWKNYNEIQLTKSKVDLKNRKMKMKNARLTHTGTRVVACAVQ